MPDLILERSEGVATITLNRPQTRNAVTADMVEGFHEFLLSVESDRGIRCVLLKGAGEHFMAGGDVRNFAESIALPAEERRRLFEARVQAVAPLLLTMQRMPQILVTAVRGACAGAGVSWVAASDLSLAARGSFFILAQIGIAVPPDGSGTWWLPRVVGLKRAKQIALLGGRLTAEEAERWGLVNEVVEEGDFDAAVSALTARLSAAPARALGLTKRLLNQSSGLSLAAQLEAEAQAFSACAADEDFVEGARAFIDKRKPRFGLDTRRS
jgi:2-(1,2-epoxy-1,2-dihydrophenyl)acetyl-CoA isomerase